MPIDLNEAITFSINDAGTTITGTANSIGDINWYKTNPALLPIAARPIILLSPTTFTPVTEQDYFFIYQRPADGCELIGKTSIQLDNAICCSSDAGNIVRPVGGIINSTTGNQSIFPLLKAETFF